MAATMRIRPNSVIAYEEIANAENLDGLPVAGIGVLAISVLPCNSMFNLNYTKEY